MIFKRIAGFAILVAAVFLAHDAVLGLMGAAIGMGFIMTRKKT